MIDLHCHLLPGLDDGPADLDQALAMCELAVQDGIRTIVATPHQLSSHGRASVQAVLGAVGQLRDRLTAENCPLNILPGAEVALQPGLVQLMFKEEILTLNNMGRFLLLECPVHSDLGLFMDELYQLRLKGVIPILAHPERNLSFQFRPETLRPFVEQGNLVQITAQSLGGRFGSQAQACSQAWLQQGLVHCLASDAHSPSSRPPCLSRAVQRAASLLQNRQAAEALVQDNPGRILDGLLPKSRPGTFDSTTPKPGLWRRCLRKLCPTGHG